MATTKKTKTEKASKTSKAAKTAKTAKAAASAKSVKAAKTSKSAKAGKAPAAPKAPKAPTTPKTSKGERTPSISEAEWRVMKVLWANSPQPAYDVIQELKDTENWHPNTVKTMLSRLHQKGALGVQKYKNLYRYYPLVSEEKCIQQESESFLQRVFGGSVQPLLVHFLKKKKVPKDEIKELKRLLQEKEK